MKFFLKSFPKFNFLPYLIFLDMFLNLTNYLNYESKFVHEPHTNLRFLKYKRSCINSLKHNHAKHDFFMHGSNMFCMKSILEFYIMFLTNKCGDIICCKFE